MAALLAALAGLGATTPGAAGCFALASRAWRQPWAPLFLEWELRYLDVPLFGPDGSPHWRFGGRDYLLEDSAARPDGAVSCLVRERSTVTPALREVLLAELRRVLQDHGLEREAIEARLAALEHWDFLSQRLDGVLDRMRCRDARSHYLPNPDGLPAPGANPGAPRPDLAVPAEQAAPLFRRASGGQFRIERLTLVDRYGQVLPLAGPWRDGPGRLLDAGNCFIAPAMQAGPDLAGAEFGAWSPSVQLAPRLLQPARLDFHPRALGTGQDGPLAGWWSWNRYNRALMVYAADGAWQGMLHAAPDGRAAFEPAPDGPALAELAGANPPLAGPLARIAAADDGGARLDALGRLLDDAGWRIDPVDEHDAWLSVLTGRPLAVIGASLGLSLQGAPLADPSWAEAFGADGLPDGLAQLRRRLAAAAPADPLAQALPMTLGDPDDPEEGLVAVWREAQPDLLLSPYAGEDGPGIAPLGPAHPLYCRFAPAPALRLCLLMDPFSSVYASCGLLPDQALALPPGLFDAALRALAPVFSMGPLLAEYEPAAEAGAPLLHMPVPPHELGQWQWLDGSGATIDLRHPGTEAHLGGRRTELREGRMLLAPHPAAPATDHAQHGETPA
ncbi:hypothetical protein HF313_16660 [Massilia atriviolacea]|uniref:hypothetical protein n=1 Tax=Massilia atriviolacea TaxID=2495579 RepID=UPI003857CF68